MDHHTLRIRLGVLGYPWGTPVIFSRTLGLGVWAVAAGWVGSAARLTADLQGRVLTLGYLAGAEGHSCIVLGLE